MKEQLKLIYKTLLKWLYEFFEIFSATFVGIIVFITVISFIKDIYISSGISFMLGYFFGDLLRPYIKEFRDFIFK